MITPTQTHTFTSDQPYNRHKYKLVFVDGRSVVIDDYETMKQAWWKYNQVVSHVNVVDKRGVSGRGF